MGFRDIDRAEAKLNRSLFVSFRNVVRETTSIEFGFHFVRLQIFVGVLPRFGLPFESASAEFDFQCLFSFW